MDSSKQIPESVNQCCPGPHNSAAATLGETVGLPLLVNCGKCTWRSQPGCFPTAWSKLWSGLYLERSFSVCFFHWLVQINSFWDMEAPSIMMSISSSHNLLSPWPSKFPSTTHRGSVNVNCLQTTYADMGKDATECKRKMLIIAYPWELSHQEFSQHKQAEKAVVLS